MPPVPETPPIVSLASPAAAAEFTLGATVALAANAAADSGSITSVVFLAHGSAIGSCSAAPFGASWMLAQPGSHWLTAPGHRLAGILRHVRAGYDSCLPFWRQRPQRIRITNSPPNGARLGVAWDCLAGGMRASGNAGIDHVEVQVNNAPAAYAAGTSNWSAQVSSAHRHQPGPRPLRGRSRGVFRPTSRGLLLTSLLRPSPCRLTESAE